MPFLLWTRHVGFPLALGGLLYVVQFAWPGLIPSWIMFYLPDALWAYALVSAVLLIWNGTERRRWYWMIAVLFCGPLLEYLQWHRLVPGQADWLDVLVFLIGGALAGVADRSRHQPSHLEQRSSAAGVTMTVTTVGFFVLSALATSIDVPETVVAIEMEFTFTDDAIVMQNQNRFSLLDWNLSLNDVRRITYSANGGSLAGLASDTIAYSDLLSTTPHVPLERDSLVRLDLICTIIAGRFGRYTELLD